MTEESRVELTKSAVVALESWVAGTKTGWLMLAWAVLTGLQWGQDAVTAIPGIGVGMASLDAMLLGIDEAVLGVPWFLITAELLRRVVRR